MSIKTAWQFDKYSDYKQLLAKHSLIPLFEELGLVLEDKFVGEFGCADGGVITALAKERNVRGVGIDIDVEKVATAERVEGIHFISGDILNLDLEYRFDLIFMIDTIEHVIDIKKALLTAASYLKPGGMIYISFPPYYSPYGGHQYWSEGFIKFFPYIHYLPKWLFNKLLKCDDIVYKSKEALRRDLLAIRRTHLTIARMDRVVRESELSVFRREIYFTRPEFRWRYNLPTIRNLILGWIPVVREMLSSGMIYILRKDS